MKILMTFFIFLGCTQLDIRPLNSKKKALPKSSVPNVTADSKKEIPPAKAIPEKTIEISGEVSKQPTTPKEYLTKTYPLSKSDLLSIFVERGLELLSNGGRLAAITSRTPFFLKSFEKWREEIVLKIGEPEVMADLGNGVMDEAFVEAAAFVLKKQ